MKTTTDSPQPAHGGNSALHKAKTQKNDEFYTLHPYIEREINAYLEYDKDAFKGKVILCPCDDPEWSNFTIFFAENFERLGLKKLISTSYAVASKDYPWNAEPTAWEMASPLFDLVKSKTRGKIFTLDHDITGDGKITHADLEWDYLDGDGDFRSDEVKKLRDEADIIITNPPFSIFRDFWAWVNEAGKKFLIIGNHNAITYKEVFRYIMNNKAWLGATCNGEDMVFGVPKGAYVAPKDRQKAEKLGYKGDYTRLGNSCWFTNMEHGRRHQPLTLMTTADIIKFSRHAAIREQGKFLKYDNYDAIEVGWIDSIPSDYDGVMGVPITFLDKYCPEQFEIIGTTDRGGDNLPKILEIRLTEKPEDSAKINGQKVYKRIFIKRISKN